MNRPMLAVALLAAMATDAAAQSTSRVGSAERVRTIELAVGGRLRNSPFPQGFDIDESVLTGSVALRWDEQGSGGFRLMLMGLQRASHSRGYDSSGEVTYSRDVTDRLVAGIGLASATFRLWRDLTIEPSAGGGVIPFVNRHEKSTNLTFNGTPSTSSGSHSGVGWMLAGALSLRYRYVFVEQRLHFVYANADAIPSSGEYYPLTIGVRF